MYKESSPSTTKENIASLAKDFFQRGHLSPSKSYELAKLTHTSAKNKEDKEQALYLGLLNKGLLSPTECEKLAPYLLDILHNSATDIPTHIRELLEKNDPQENNTPAPEKFISTIARIKFWILSQISK